MIEKINEKKQAILLREQGLSVGKIAKNLKVSKGSVSVWVRHVILTDEMIQDNIRYRNSVSASTLLKYAHIRKKKAKEIRLKYQEEGYKMAKKDDSQYAFGCALYLGEGAKERSNCKICNTDVILLKTFVSFLKKYFNVKNKEIKINILHYNHNNLTLDDVTKYWIDKLKIFGCKVSKPTIKEGIMEKNKYPYGLCTVSVHNTEIVQKIFGSIRAYTNSKEIRFID